jgi:hypothetical protein
MHTYSVPVYFITLACSFLSGWSFQTWCPLSLHLICQSSSRSDTWVKNTSIQKKVSKSVFADADENTVNMSIGYVEWYCNGFFTLSGPGASPHSQCIGSSNGQHGWGPNPIIQNAGRWSKDSTSHGFNTPAGGTRYSSDTAFFFILEYANVLFENEPTYHAPFIASWALALLLHITCWMHENVGGSTDKGNDYLDMTLLARVAKGTDQNQR